MNWPGGLLWHEALLSFFPQGFGSKTQTEPQPHEVEEFCK
jgi:hypothetical protein